MKLFAGDLLDPEDSDAGLIEAIQMKLATWDTETLLDYAKQELVLEFPEEFEELEDLIAEMAVEIMKDANQKDTWADELRYKSPEELYG